VTVNDHTLSDFRVRPGAALDEVMAQGLGHVHAAGLIAFGQVAQAGIRVRAPGAASYRRGPRPRAARARAGSTIGRAAATAEQVIVGVDGTTSGSDAAQAVPPGVCPTNGRWMAGWWLRHWGGTGCPGTGWGCRQPQSRHPPSGAHLSRGAHVLNPAGPAAIQSPRSDCFTSSQSSTGRLTPDDRVAGGRCECTIPWR
jgi:hypothetical protein